LIEVGKLLPIFGDGSTGRDYAYVDDIVAYVMAALAYESRLDLPLKGSIWGTRIQLRWRNSCVCWKK